VRGGLHAEEEDAVGKGSHGSPSVRRIRVTRNNAKVCDFHYSTKEDTF
jgi:hypothetical protein